MGAWELVETTTVYRRDDVFSVARPDEITRFVEDAQAQVAAYQEASSDNTSQRKADKAKAKAGEISADDSLQCDSRQVSPDDAVAHLRELAIETDERTLRPVRKDRVVGQVTVVVHHDPVKIVPAMEHVFSMVAVGIEATMPRSVWADHPDIRVSADDNDIRIDYGRYVDIGGHWLIGLFDDHKRRRRGRWRRIECPDHCVHLGLLTLVVGLTYFRFSRSLSHAW